MSRAVLILLTAGAVLAGLAGCTANDEDLRQWMAEQRRTTTPKVTPLTEPTRYMPLAYAGERCIIAKSGGFGDEGTLATLLAMFRGTG